MNPVELIRAKRDGETHSRETIEAFVQAIVNLARSLQLTVVAEGVENPAQLEFLNAVGCQAYQGYLGGRPVDPETFGKLLG